MSTNNHNGEGSTPSNTKPSLIEHYQQKGIPILKKLATIERTIHYGEKGMDLLIKLFENIPPW